MSMAVLDKTLFTKTDEGLGLACRPKLADITHKPKSPPKCEWDSDLSLLLLGGSGSGDIEWLVMTNKNLCVYNSLSTTVSREHTDLPFNPQTS